MVTRGYNDPIIVNESKIKEIFDISKIKPTIADFTKKVAEKFKHVIATVKGKLIKNKDAVKEAAIDITSNTTFVSSIDDHSKVIADKLGKWLQDYYNGFKLDCKVSVSKNTVTLNFGDIVKKVYDETLEDEKKKNSELYNIMKKDKSAAYKVIYWKLIWKYVDGPVSTYFKAAFDSVIAINSRNFKDGDFSLSARYTYKDDSDAGICTISVDSFIEEKVQSSKREAAMILIEALSLILDM